MSYTLVMAFHGQSGGLNNSNAPLNVLAQVAGIPAFGEVIAVGAYVSFFACTLASINAAARVIFSMARHGLLPAPAGRAHTTHGTPHVAVLISALLVLGMPLALFFLGSSLLDIYGYLATIATFGFLVAYVLISIAAPLELRREKALSVGPLALAFVAVVLLMIPAVGSIYPLPAAPMSYLPFIFVGLLAIGTLWFLYLRASQPPRFRTVQDDSSVN
jgi:amino acid transporter